MTEQGHVLAVSQERLGDDLDVAASAGATSLTVGDIADFDELGGMAWLNGQVLTYTSADDETGAIVLASALPSDAAVGDRIFVWDPSRQVIVTDLVAQVQVDGDIDGDPYECSVAYHLVKDLPGGIRGLVGESVLIEQEDDDWRVVDILGLGDPDGSGTLFKRDAMTVTATGEQTMTLTYEPLEDSLHLRWEPINMDDTEWTRDGKVVTIPDTLNPFQVGDVITAKYAYRKGVTDPINVQFGDGGWRYLVVAEGSATNYSAVSFDDSAWSVSTGPIGYPLSLDPGPEVWPIATTTTGSLNVGFWMRKTIVIPPGPTVFVNVRARPDGQYWLYADGTLLASYTGSGTTGTTIGPFAVAMAPGTHVIAFHVNDDVPDPGTDYIYGDVEVIQ